MSNPRVPFQMATERVKLSPLNGKPIIVHIVVNVEYWPFDQPMPRKVLSTPHGIDRIPDIPNYSWAEYGLRSGMPRMMKLFARYNLPVSVNINAAVIDVYPSLAKAMRDAGWEFICHGMTQRLLHVEKDEATTIQACISKVQEFVKKRPRGWMGPGFAETFDTPDLLKAAGIEYLLVGCGGNCGGEKHRVDRGARALRRLAQADAPAEQAVLGDRGAGIRPHPRRRIGRPVGRRWAGRIHRSPASSAAIKARARS